MHYWLLKKETKFESIYNMIKIDRTLHWIGAGLLWDGVSTVLQQEATVMVTSPAFYLHPAYST